MRYLIFLFLLPTYGFCNEVNLYLIQRLTDNGFTVIEEWVDPVPFVYIGVELNISNAKVIIIRDQNEINGICNNESDQLLYFRTSEPIQANRMMFRINDPCAYNNEIELILDVIGADKKHYYKTLKFIKR